MLFFNLSIWIFFVANTLGAPSIVKKDDDLDTTTAFADAVNATWDTFWDNSKNAWNVDDPACGDSFSYPSVWKAAVASKAISDTFDKTKIYEVTQSLIDNYKNSDGWFSATTAKDDDVYTDDNSQVVWVLLDSYKYTGTIDHLTVAEKVLSNIKDQWDSSIGGVKWSINGDYVASISTAESALAAIRLYQLNNDESLLEFSKTCIDFLFDKLQDPSDHLLYDGITVSSGEVNKGKLTYTVGTTISTLSYLIKTTGDQSYNDKAVQLAKAAINKNGAFYTNGYWNNQLQYIHLLYAGFVDLITVSTADNQKQSGFYQKLISEMNRQATYTYDYLQISKGYYYHNVYTYTDQMYSKYTSKFGSSKSYNANPKNFCGGDVNGTPKKDLMDNASAAQIFYELSRVSS